MRTARVFLGSLAALALMTAPVLARDSNARPAEDRPATSSCHTMQRGADGEWISIPCEEIGTPAQPQPRSARGAETENH